MLIKSHQLGDILDNLFQNSIKFLKNSNTKKIRIELYKESPKIIIKFSNSGTKIEHDQWEKIFEQGYSGSKSTGLGLFSSREVLKKYGGRIFIQNSNSNETSFIIELNEGVINKN